LERKNLFEWISVNHTDLNVLVNNAGIQQAVPLSDDTFYDLAKEEIVINIEAPIHLASLFIRLKSMNTIINVTSGLAFVPMVRMPVYCASKAFLHSFTLSMRELLKDRNIEVVELIPPALNTDLGGKGRHDYAPPVSDFIQVVFEQLALGKNEITFGFSDAMIKAGPEDLHRTFLRMNQLG
jgi:uncharacterized oxidoreductase